MALISGKASFSLESPLRGRAPIFVLALFLFLAIDALYGKFLWNPLVFDDFNLFDGRTLQQYAHSSFRFDLRWFPYASLAWTDRIFGPLLVWFRTGNLVLHFCVSICLFLFLRRLFGLALQDSTGGLSNDWLAFFGSLLFALNPAAVYAVGYLVQRSIVMATGFGLLMLLGYLEGVEKKSTAWFLFSALCYFLSVFSKEHAVMLPAVALSLTPLLIRPSRQWLEDLWLPFVLYAMVGLFVVMKAKGVLGSPYEIYGTSMIESEKVEVSNAYPLSILTQCGLFFKYLSLWIFPEPSRMSVDMREPFVSGFLTLPGILGTAAFLIYPSLALKFLLKGGRIGLAGFGMLFPWLLFLTELSTVRIQESFVLYRSYLWMGGLFAVLPFVFRKIPAKAAFLLLLGLSAILFPLARDRLISFSSPLLLWGDAARLVEGRAGLVGLDRIYYNLGLAELNAGKYPEAAGDFGRVVRISPKIYQAWYSRAYAYYMDKQYGKALSDFDRAIELNDGYGNGYFMRGLTYRHVQREAQALADFRRSCDLGVSRGCSKLK